MISCKKPINLNSGLLRKGPMANLVIGIMLVAEFVGLVMWKFGKKKPKQQPSMNPPKNPEQPF